MEVEQLAGMGTIRTSRPLAVRFRIVVAIIATARLLAVSISLMRMAVAALAGVFVWRSRFK